MMIKKVKCKKKEDLCLPETSNHRPASCPVGLFDFLIKEEKRGSLSTTEKKGRIDDRKQSEGGEWGLFFFATTHLRNKTISGIVDESGMTIYRWGQAECWPKGPEGATGKTESTKSEA